jgi:hypothetical protein
MCGAAGVVLEQHKRTTYAPLAAQTSRPIVVSPCAEKPFEIGMDIAEGKKSGF